MAEAVVQVQDSEMDRVIEAIIRTNPRVLIDMSQGFVDTTAPDIAARIPAESKLPLVERYLRTVLRDTVVGYESMVAVQEAQADNSVVPEPALEPIVFEEGEEEPATPATPPA